MTPDLSRRAAHAMTGLSMIGPAMRLRIAEEVEDAETWDDLPDDVRTVLEMAEDALRDGEYVHP